MNEDKKVIKQSQRVKVNVLLNWRDLKESGQVRDSRDTINTAM